MWKILEVPQTKGWSIICPVSEIVRVRLRLLGLTMARVMSLRAA